MNASRRILLRVVIVYSFFAMQACSSVVDENFCPDVAGCAIDSFFFDDFDRSNELLNVNADWVFLSPGGTLEIVSNEVFTNLTAPIAPSVAHYSTIIPQDNVKISMDARITGANFGTTGAGVIALLLRNAATENFNNMYFCGLDEAFYGDGQLVIYKRVSGSATLLQQSAVNALPLVNGSSYSLSFSAEGNTLTCTASGAADVTISITDDSFTSGYVGFGGFNSSAEGQLALDNFRVDLL